MRLSEEIVAVLAALSKQNGRVPASALADAARLGDFGEALAECEGEGLLLIHTDGGVELTEGGREAVREVERRLTSADRLAPGERARVAYVKSGNYPRFQKLTSLGLAPGVPVKLQQKFPSFVIEVEETQVALEADIARDIFVWRGER
jgi:Fe2+ transport system protein FeoA